jgi:peptidoglycan-associated lipoprotein
MSKKTTLSPISSVDSAFTREFRGKRISQNRQSPSVKMNGLTFYTHHSMSKRHIALLSFVSLAFLSACSSTKLDNTSDVTGKSVDGAGASGVSSVAAVVADHLNPNSLISTQRSVYFDFDQFNVKASETAVVERQGKYLASKPNLAIRLEGNADERGGREYNLALGQKRAEAVARALKVYGVSDKQAEPVSFGSEKPKAQGHDEAAWAQNRRVDFAYPAK